jgi:hypothetical protein
MPFAVPASPRGSIAALVVPIHLVARFSRSWHPPTRNLSARRFAEYLSLGQVPSGDASRDVAWVAPGDEVAERSYPSPTRRRTAIPRTKRPPHRYEQERDGIVAGTLRAPWRWEELLVESAVIGQLDRWERRLRGLSRRVSTTARGARVR